MRLIDGKAIAAKRLSALKEEISLLKGRPSLAVVMVGNSPASEVYVRNKRKAAEEVGIKTTLHLLPESITQKELLRLIETLNQDPSIHGILVQTPLPGEHSMEEVMRSLSPLKDVDGFHPVNVGKLLIGEKDGFISCTPLGILTLLQEEKVPLKGKEMVIVGRSTIVGKPLAALLIQPGIDATVTIAHSKTEDLPSVTKRADILVAAAGVPRLIKGSMVKEGAVLIDVGITRQDRKLIGDIDFESAKEKASLITPVPGGVGPMTIAMLLENSLLAFRRCASSSFSSS